MTRANEAADFVLLSLGYLPRSAASATAARLFRKWGNDGRSIPTIIDLAAEIYYRKLTRRQILTQISRLFRISQSLLRMTIASEHSRITTTQTHGSLQAILRSNIANYELRTASENWERRRQQQQQQQQQQQRRRHQQQQQLQQQRQQQQQNQFPRPPPPSHSNTMPTGSAPGPPRTPGRLDRKRKRPATDSVTKGPSKHFKQAVDDLIQAVLESDLFAEFTATSFDGDAGAVPASESEVSRPNLHPPDHALPPAPFDPLPPLSFSPLPPLSPLSLSPLSPLAPLPPLHADVGGNAGVPPHSPASTITIDDSEEENDDDGLVELIVIDSSDAQSEDEMEVNCSDQPARLPDPADFAQFMARISPPKPRHFRPTYTCDSSDEETETTGAEATDTETLPISFAE